MEEGGADHGRGGREGVSGLEKERWEEEVKARTLWGQGGTKGKASWVRG